MFSGCVTTTPSSGDKTQIAAVMQQWREGMLANDVARIMPLYSPHFTTGENYAPDHYDGVTIKTYLTELAQRMADSEDTRINLEDADTVITGTTATVAPIGLGIRKGAGVMRINLAKEDGHWRIIGMAKK
jgi:hypothetical protein